MKLSTEQMARYDELVKSGRLDDAILAGEFDSQIDKRKFAALNSRFDANESLFLTRSLTLIESQLYRVQYPGLKARQLFQVVNSGAGLESIGYQQLDQTGRAAIKAGKATDVPRIDLTSAEYLKKVRHLVDAYGWDFHELRQAARAGFALGNEKAMAAREAIERELENLAFLGDDTYDIPGLMTHALDYNEYQMPADGTSSSKKITAKTADLALRDIQGILNKVETGTEGLYRANRLLVPVEVKAYLQTTPRSATSDTTLEMFLKANNPGLQIESSYQMNSVTVTLDSGTFTSKGIAVAWYDDPLVAKLFVPSEFEALPVQERGFEYIVNCTMDVLGLVVYKPYAFAIAGDV